MPLITQPPSTWDEHYAQPDQPWDTGEPEPAVVAFVGGGGVKPGRCLELGAGTGTNALWLAEQGFDVIATDVSPLAVAKAEAKAREHSGRLRCRFLVHDFLAGDGPGAPFDFVFDRGCFHIFDEAEERARFAEQVAAILSPEGCWLSLIGSTEGPAREFGPPRRSARDIAAAIEPALAIEELTAVSFGDLPWPAKMWSCLSARRAVPAQPSTRRD
jgi:SAM-dependent methyltransferase